MFYKRLTFIVSGLLIIGLLITGQGSDSSALASTPAAGLSPDGKRIVISLRGDIYVRNSDGSGEANLTRSEGTDEEPKWSPDGLRIVFRSDADYVPEPLVEKVMPFKLYLMKADGSDLRRLTSGGYSDFCPAWSPDGNKIAFLRSKWTSEYNEEAGLLIIDLKSGAILWHNRIDGEGVNCPQWSPDGEWLTYADKQAVIHNIPLRAFKSDFKDAIIHYRVAFVAEGDLLNVRQGPGVEFATIDRLENATAVMINGQGERIGSDIWVPISYQGSKTGWVNRAYLEGEPDDMAFCFDPRPPQILEAFREAVRAADGQAIARLIAPRGLYIHVMFLGGLSLSVEQVGGIFTDKTLRNWGSVERQGTLVDQLAPQLRRDFLSPKIVIACNRNQDTSVSDPVSLGTLLAPGYYPNTYYSIHRRAPEDKGFDWSNWALVFDYWDGKPLISALYHYEWTP